MYNPSGWVMEIEMSKIRDAAAEMGRKGGKSKSQAKADAARKNGRKGGRPVVNK